jgi:hypothetical protein
VVGSFRGPLLVYMNRWGAPEKRIALTLRVPDGMNREAVGAFVTLRTGARVQLREVRSGSSYLSQSTKELLFGLGEAKKADEIRVRWPDGRVQTATDVAGGSRLVWTEGSAPAARLYARADPTFNPSRPAGAGAPCPRCRSAAP